MAVDRLADMSVFVQVVEQGGFSAAARRLGLSPSAVSKLVGRLEDRLGARLLHRTTRSLTPTAEGLAYVERCREILADIDALEAGIGQSDVRPRGALRVSLSHAFGFAQILPLVPDFAALHPEVELKLLFTDRAVDLVADGIDMAVRLGAITDESLIARRLGEHRRIVCAAPAYLARRGTPAVPADLHGHDCLLFEEAERLNRWPFRDAGGERVLVPVRGTIASNNGEALYALLLSGMGIARAADFLVVKDIAAGRLVPILTGHAVDEMTPIHAVYPHRKHLAAKVRVFLDFLVARFAGSPWLAV